MILVKKVTPKPFNQKKSGNESFDLTIKSYKKNIKDRDTLNETSLKCWVAKSKSTTSVVFSYIKFGVNTYHDYNHVIKV